MFYKGDRQKHQGKESNDDKGIISLRIPFRNPKEQKRGFKLSRATLATQRKHFRNGAQEKSIGPHTLGDKEGRLLRRAHRFMHVSNRNYAFWTYSVRAEKEKVRVLRLVSPSAGLGRNAKM